MSNPAASNSLISHSQFITAINANRTMIICRFVSISIIILIIMKNNTCNYNWPDWKRMLCSTKVECGENKIKNKKWFEGSATL